VARDAEQDSRPVIIKKYANRRLYNTDTSTYVTLEDLAEMVRSERDFVVYDAKTGEDLTHSVLTQIIVEQESRGTNLLPIGFLRQLIRFYGDSMQKLVPSYLGVQPRFLDPPAGAVSPAFRSCLRDCGLRGDAGAGAQEFRHLRAGARPVHPFRQDRAAEGNGEQPAAGETKPANSKPAEDEIATLKAELSAMQQRLEQLSRR
jgi:polyhydroxyalkanoate synthesis repressor PhaR